MMHDLQPKEEYIPRNYWLGMLNGILVLGGSIYLATDTVLAVFVKDLFGSDVLVGVLVAVHMTGFHLPSLAVAHLTETAERKKSLYIASATGRIVFLTSLVLAVVLVGDGNPTLLYCLIAGCLFGYYACISVGVLSFFEIVSHSVPVRRRGAFFAWRRSLGHGLLAVPSLFLIWYLLGEDNPPLQFPYNYAVLFGLALVLCGAGTLTFCFVKEPVMHVDRRGEGFRSKIIEGLRHSVLHVRFRQLIACRLLIQMTLVGSSFYVLHSLKILAEPDKKAAIFVATAPIVSPLINPLWAKISDGRGTVKLLRTAYLLGAVAPLIALCLPLFSSRVVGPAELGITPQWIAAVVFFAMSKAALYGNMLGAQNYVMEIAPPGRRPIYIGVVSIYMVFGTLVATIAGGALADKLGSYALNLVLASVFALAAVLIAFKMKEPRDHVPADEEPQAMPITPA